MTHTYRASISWQRQQAVFTDNRYSRAHQWTFDGIQVPASSSPQVVPVPYSMAAAVDPEEAFVAALSSCHMLWFLSLAAKSGFVVDSYRDDALGLMGPNPEGKLAMLEVTLRPEVEFGGTRKPEDAEAAALHHAAHSQCFLANSVKTSVRCEPAMKSVP